MNAATPPNETSSPARKVDATAIGVDTIFVIIFAAIGYYTHHDTLPLSGLVSTAWPFVSALLAAHLLLVTVSGGMALRQLTDEGTATAFIVVTTIFNAATLLGWRLAALIARRNKAHAER